MAMPAPSQLEWTAEMARALPEDGNRYEVIDVELLVTPAPSQRHQRAMELLYLALAPYARGSHLMHAHFAPCEIEFSAARAVQPDLYVVRLMDGKMPADAELGRAVLLVVEGLSPTTARYDRRKKRPMFQSEGVPDFWIVDIDTVSLVYHSPAAEKIWGFDPAVNADDPQRIGELVHRDDFERFTLGFGNMLVEATEVEYRITRPDGALRWLRSKGFPVRSVDGSTHRIGGTDRHRRFIDDDHRPRQRAPDRARDFQHVREIGAAIFVGWRTDRDEHDLRVRHRRFGIGRETQASALAVGAHQRLEARLVDRNFAALEARDLVDVDVDADHVVADFGKTGSGHETDVAGAKDRHAHDEILFIEGEAALPPMRLLLAVQKSAATDGRFWTPWPRKPARLKYLF